MPSSSRRTRRSSRSSSANGQPRRRSLRHFLPRFARPQTGIQRHYAQGRPDQLYQDTGLDALRRLGRIMRRREQTRHRSMTWPSEAADLVYASQSNNPDSYRSRRAPRRPQSSADGLSGSLPRSLAEAFPQLDGRDFGQESGRRPLSCRETHSEEPFYRREKIQSRKPSPKGILKHLHGIPRSIFVFAARKSGKADEKEESSSEKAKPASKRSIPFSTQFRFAGHEGPGTGGHAQQERRGSPNSQRRAASGRRNHLRRAFSGFLRGFRQRRTSFPSLTRSPTSHEPVPAKEPERRSALDFLPITKGTKARYYGGGRNQDPLNPSNVRGLRYEDLFPGVAPKNDDILQKRVGDQIKAAIQQEKDLKAAKLNRELEKQIATARGIEASKREDERQQRRERADRRIQRLADTRLGRTITSSYNAYQQRREEQRPERRFWQIVDSDIRQSRRQERQNRRRELREAKERIRDWKRCERKARIKEAKIRF